MASISAFLSNARLMYPLPFPEDEDILVTPRMVFKSPSNGAVTSCSINLGEAPDHEYLTLKDFIVRVGCKCTGSLGIKAAPMIISIIEITRIEKAEVFRIVDIFKLTYNSIKIT
jgi:hypothetical protein